MSKVYFQIGTNNGNDRFRQLVIKDNPDMVILVEPNESLISEIKYNYKDIKNVYVYNNAVYYTNDEIIELYIPAKHGIMGMQADNGFVYTSFHFSLFPMNNWGEKEDMYKIKCKSITFDKICDNHNIVNIDYLQIDTEGFDTEIIKMIDLSKYKIKSLRFEKWPFNKECFTKYNNDKADILGDSGLNEVKEKLLNHNYYFTDISDEDGADILATLEE